MISPRSKVSKEMLARLQAARTKYRGDPFRPYREQGILPEKFMYGMNCFLDSIAEDRGDEFIQMVYEEIRKDRNAYTIDTTPDGVDLGGVPVLFSVKLGAVKDAVNRAIDAANRITATNIRELLTIYVYHEPEPETTIGLDAFIRTVNQHA